MRSNALLLGLAVIAVAAPAGLAGAATAPAKFKGQELASQATVTLATARTIALKARPGRIVDQELERERGGSGLRYAFDVVSRGKTYEVGVDAKSGQLLENGAETAAQEAAEARSEHAHAPASAAVKNKP
jgi:hypothetical protein